MKKILFIICFITSLVSNGQYLQWAKQFNCVIEEESIVVDSIGNVYRTGYFSGTVDFDPGPGVYNLNATSVRNTFVLKIDAFGNFVWAVSIGGISEGYGIDLDFNSNVYVTGSFIGTVDFNPGLNTYNLSTISHTSIFILKLDDNGNFIWAKAMITNGPMPNGVDARSIGMGICTDNLGNVCTSGYFLGSVDFDPGIGVFNLAQENYSFITKLDSSGNFVWAQSSIYQIEDISTDQNNNLYLLSPTRIEKLDNSGNLLSSTQLGGDHAYSMDLDSLGNCYIVGSFQGTKDFDPGPAVYNLTGYGINTSDIFILKINSLGNFVWAKQIGSYGFDEAYSVCFEKGGGNIYITGIFAGYVDFNPGSGVFYLTGPQIVSPPYSPNFNLFTLKLDSAANFLWANSVGPLNYPIPRANQNVVDGFGNLYVTGVSSYGIVDFDSGPGIYNLGNPIDQFIFLFKLGPVPNGIKENYTVNNFIIYPNPANNSLNIEFDAESFTKLKGTTVVEISNTLGQIVLKGIMDGNNLNLDIKNLNTGLYFIKVLNDNKVIATQKVVKD